MEVLIAHGASASDEDAVSSRSNTKLNLKNKTFLTRDMMWTIYPALQKAVAQTGPNNELLTHSIKKSLTYANLFLIKGLSAKRWRKKNRYN